MLEAIGVAILIVLTFAGLIAVFLAARWAWKKLDLGDFL